MTANFADLLRVAAGRDPDGAALVDAATGAATTWRALDEAVSGGAAALERVGLVAGHRVLLATGNRPELVVALLAVLRARMVAVPVNPRTTAEEMRRLVVDSGARMVVADRTTAPAARKAAREVDPADEPGSSAVRLVVLDDPPEPGELGFAELLAGGPVAELPGNRDPETLAVLLYTSGASAASRAAMVSHRALLAQVEQAQALALPPGGAPREVMYAALPVFHVYGLSAVLGLAMRRGATLVTAETGAEPGVADAEEALRHVERHGVTVVAGPPALFEQWQRRDDLDERLANVRLLVSGSGPLATDTVQALLEKAGVRVHQGYGLTEAGPAITSTLLSPSYKPGSVGVAVPGVRLRVLDESGREPEGADPGQVHVAGDQLFSGYWPDGADGPDDGWFPTGDVGFLDAEGDLFFVDRLRDAVVVSGFTVYPREVEEVLLEVEGVSAAAVVGVPDAGAGEAVVAWVQVDHARRAGVEDRVAQACAARLARFKQPVRVEVVEELPRTASGKIAKGRLRAALRQEPGTPAGGDR